MKHYFYFKKGQSVPQWLMRQRDVDTKQVMPMLQFKVSGKVMVDDVTGAAFIWPASKRPQCFIFACALDRPILLDIAELGSANYLFSYNRAFEWSVRSRKKIFSPLTLARWGGQKIHTTTKCAPLPDNFDRRGGAA